MRRTAGRTLAFLVKLLSPSPPPQPTAARARAQLMGMLDERLGRLDACMGKLQARVEGLETTLERVKVQVNSKASEQRGSYDGVRTRLQNIEHVLTTKLDSAELVALEERIKEAEGQVHEEQQQRCAAASLQQLLHCRSS